MDKLFNIDRLDIDTVELLVLLMEECGEVIQAASKCIRCIDYVHPSTGTTNQQNLKIELVDLRIIMNRLQMGEELCQMRVSEYSDMRNAKMEKLRKWTNVFKPKDV